LPAFVRQRWAGDVAAQRFQRLAAVGTAARSQDSEGSRSGDQLAAASAVTLLRRSFNALLNTLNTTVLERFHRRDFSAVFERYIHS
jgi:hypothetical protein